MKYNIYSEYIEKIGFFFNVLSFYRHDADIFMFSSRSSVKHLLNYVEYFNKKNQTFIILRRDEVFYNKHQNEVSICKSMDNLMM